MANNEGSVSLVDLCRGEKGTIVVLKGKRELVGRLSALGFTQGLIIEMVRNDGRGPVIVSILGTTIALGREQARDVLVRKETENN